MTNYLRVWLKLSKYWKINQPSLILVKYCEPARLEVTVAKFDLVEIKSAFVAVK